MERVVKIWYSFEIVRNSNSTWIFYHWTCLPLTGLYQVENDWFEVYSEEESSQENLVPKQNNPIYYRASFK